MESLQGREKWKFHSLGSCHGGEKWKFPSLGSPHGEEKWKFPSLGSPHGGGKWKFPSLGSPHGGKKWKFPSLGSPHGGEKWKFPSLGEPPRGGKVKILSLGSPHGGKPPLAPLTDLNKPAVWAATPREAGWISKWSGQIIVTTFLVGGIPTHLEKYESQLGWLFLIYGKIKNVSNHQPVTVTALKYTDFEIYEQVL